MNIPQSTIEPFGFTGIPVLMCSRKKNMDMIMEAVFHSVMTDTSNLVPPSLVCAGSEYTALTNGAEYANAYIEAYSSMGVNTIMFVAECLQGKDKRVSRIAIGPTTPYYDKYVREILRKSNLASEASANAT